MENVELASFTWGFVFGCAIPLVAAAIASVVAERKKNRWVRDLRRAVDDYGKAVKRFERASR